MIQEIKSSDITVGDIVKIEKNEEFPCDILLMTSSDPEGNCDVTTANLDGETNLKVCLEKQNFFHILKTHLQIIPLCKISR